MSLVLRLLFEKICAFPAGSQKYTKKHTQAKINKVSICCVVSPVLVTRETAVKMSDLVLVLILLQLIQTLPICEWQGFNPHPNDFSHIEGNLQRDGPRNQSIPRRCHFAFVLPVLSEPSSHLSVLLPLPKKPVRMRTSMLRVRIRPWTELCLYFVLHPVSCTCKVFLLLSGVSQLLSGFLPLVSSLHVEPQETPWGRQCTDIVSFSVITSFGSFPKFPLSNACYKWRKLRCA